MIRVFYKGRFVFKITWLVDGEVIEIFRRKVEIKIYLYYFIFVIYDAEKKDSGVYKFFVENFVGLDMVNILVYVIGK